MNPKTVERIREINERPPHVHCWHFGKIEHSSTDGRPATVIETCCECPGTRTMDVEYVG
jgi:hypothetical protein